MYNIQSDNSTHHLQLRICFYRPPLYIIITESIIIILLGLGFTITPSSVQVITVQMTPSPFIDVCGSNPCDQICTVIDGGFECSCIEGFVLESNGRSCEGQYNKPP